MFYWVLIGLEVVIMKQIVYQQFMLLSLKQYSLDLFDPLKVKVKVRIEEK